MTTPGGGNVGTAFGKVRIVYESSQAAKTAKDLRTVQDSMQATAAAGVSSAKGVAQTTGALSQLSTASRRLGQVNVANPAAGLGRAVETETQRATAALAGMQKQAQRGQNIKMAINVSPSSVTVDRRAIEKMVRDIQLDAVTLRVPVTIEASDVSVNTDGIASIAENVVMDTITIKAPFQIDPTDVQVNQGALNKATQKATKAAQGATPSAASTSSGGDGGKAGMAGMLGMLGKITAAATAAGAALGGVGYVVTKGFSRLNSIDEATNKLKILGLTAGQIQNVSGSALKSVEGTAFGLQEAFSVSAEAINSGIKPGQQLEKYLGATANTAALAGTSMVELGSAFSQAATQGKLTGDIAQLLYSRQVPLIKLISDEYGVSAKAAQDMVSNGEVSFDRFINAMSKTGGAAKAMGNTIGGSFNNLKAAVGRLGANLLAPFFAKKDADGPTIIATAIQKVTSVVDGLGKTLKANAGAVIGFWAGVGKVAAAAGQAILGTVAGFLAGIADMARAIAWVPDLLSKFAEWTGKSDLAKDTKGHADMLRGFADATDEGSHSFKLWADRLGATGPAIDKWAKDAREAAAAAKEAGDAGETATPQMVSVAEALESMDLKAKDAEAGLKGTNEQFKEFIKTVKDKGGTDSLIAQLKEMRSQFENGGRQVESYADAIEKMSDSTASASDKAESLISALKGLGVLPGGGALASYNEEFEKMTSYTSDIINNLDTVGNALAKSDGTLDLNTSNGRAVLEQIESIRSAMAELVISGEANPDEAYQRTVDGLNQLLQGQAGISPDVAQKIIDTYLPKDALLKSITASDPKSGLEALFANDPARLQSELNLLTTSQDIVNQLVGPDGKLHIPMVLDQPPVVDPNAAPPVEPPPPPAPPPAIPQPKASVPGDGYRGEKPPSVAPAPSVPPVIGDPSRSSNVLPPSVAELAADPMAFDKALVENPTVAAPLQELVDHAREQGVNMSTALADGIASGDEEVKKALLELAKLSGDYLGNSPAKYGPLSGKGWTLYRGKTFTKDWAKGIASEAGSVSGAVEDAAGNAAKAVGSLSNSGSGGFGGNGVTWSDGRDQLIADLQQFSDFGKSLLDFGKQIGDIAFGSLKLFNDLSGGTLFPKSYTPDKDAKKPGSSLGNWNPTTNKAMQPGLNGQPNPGSRSGTPSLAGTPAAQGGNAESIQRAIIAKAQAMGFNEEQTLAALAVANQETGYGTNPRTNVVQNQNGTPGITGVFQQDMGYRKYGDPRDPNVAIEGFLTEFANRGKGLNAEDPWAQAVAGVQKPADVGNGGYWDRSGAGAGNYLKQKQRQQALDVYNKIMGGSSAAPAPQAPVPTSVTPSATTQPAPAGTVQPKGPLTAVSETGGFVDGAGNVFSTATGGSLLGTWQGKGTFKPGGAVPVGPTPATTTSSAAPVLDPSVKSKLKDSGSATTVPAGQTAAAILTQLFPGIASIGGSDNRPAGTPQMHTLGRALDIGIGEVNAKNQAMGDEINKFLRANKDALGLDSTIWRDQWADFAGNTSTVGGHQNHVHAQFGANAVANPALLQNASSLSPEALAAISQTGQQGVPVTLTGQSAQALTGLWENTSGLPSMPSQLRDVISQDPELSKALSNTGALTQETAVPVLQKLDGLAAAQEKAGRTDLSEALGGYKSQLQGQFGLKEGPSGLDQAQSLFQGATGVASDVFAAIDSGLKYMTGLKDFTTTMVRGIANTGDVMKVVDQIQTGIDFAAKMFQAAGSITSFAGSFTGGSDFGGTSAAGQALSMIGTVISAVNTGIDVAQEAYKIGTKYLGRFIQSWTGLSGASDVRYLLDEVTGQVAAYSSDNPQQRTLFNTLGRELGGSRYGERPPVTNNLTVYQGPGQDPRDTMDDAMFTIRASGVGAFGGAL